jgi:hypothetical protein
VTSSKPFSFQPDNAFQLVFMHLSLRKGCVKRHFSHPLPSQSLPCFPANYLQNYLHPIRHFDGYVFGKLPQKRKPPLWKGASLTRVRRVLGQWKTCRQYNAALWPATRSVVGFPVQGGGATWGNVARPVGRLGGVPNPRQAPCNPPGRSLLFFRC